HRSEETTTVQLKGKFAYMSPEQARGQPLDQRSDVFSAGVVLCELLTQRRLFEGANDLEVLEKVKMADIPAEYLKDVPPELQAILYLALAVNVEGRYSSANAFLHDLQRYVHDSGEIAAGFELGQILREQLAPPTSARDEEKMLPQGTTRATRFLPVSSRSLLQTAGHVMMAAIVAFGGGFSMTSHGMVIPLSPQAQQEKQNVVVALLPPPVAAAVPTTAEKPKKEASVSVQARPWGVVTIPGYLADRETPLQGIKVQAGRLLVSVLHPPSGRKVSRELNINEGGRATCIADFTNESQIDCRNR
ncbi:MAG: protein kinase, partial [Deltaproteobacteria bacterium]|nr:protein kinase [Deltaproteobacteria bacterium]